MSASYKRGVEFVALNDEPRIFTEDDMEAMASVHLLAVLFDKDSARVAKDVVRFRERLQEQEDRMQGEHDA